MSQVLVVDDEAGLRMAIETNFRLSGWKVATASGTSDALAKFRTNPCPLVITDMRMPDGSGLEVMRGVRELAPRTAFIFLTAYGNVPEAVAAMKDGACDYLVKPVAFERLQQTARRVLAESDRNLTAEDAEGTEGKPRGFAASISDNRERSASESLDELVGGCEVFRRAIERARQAAFSDADILVEAESGTGKELFARMIHRASARRGQPFVAVNCAAFPETLLESELFGHVRGAFTGAATTRPGKFELANGGTLLLDEIGEMPITLQPKLLRVLQEREVDRLGDTRSLPVDVRIIATTNRSLLALVEEGKFRADLYYRLNVVPLALPALRNRREDIPRLAAHFLRKHSRLRRGSSELRFTDELLDKLALHNWPGNVRELENFVRRALALSSGEVVGVELLDEIGWERGAVRPRGLEAGVSLDAMERTLVERTLAATGGNRTHAAEMLGVSLRTVRNKIRQYGLAPRTVN